MMRTHKQTHRSIAAVVAPIALALASIGCGDEREAEPATPAQAATTEAPSPSAPRPAEAVPNEGRVEVTVDGQGYHPSTIHARRGEPLTLVFTRTSDQSCGETVVFPAQDVRRELPLNEPVAVVITPEGDSVRFTCGMDMYRGEIVAHEGT